MSKLKLYTTKGVKKSEVTTPKVLGLDINLNFLAQALRVYEFTSHVGLSRSKTRADVNKTKKKLYKQKGTGGARHGAKSAPIFVGGGVAHGPKLEKRPLTLSKKMKKVAKFMSLAYKVKEGKVVLVEDLSKLKKTKEFAGFLTKVKADNKAKKMTLVYNKESKLVSRNTANIQNVNTVSFDKLNAFDVVSGGLVILEEGLL